MGGAGSWVGKAQEAKANPEGDRFEQLMKASGKIREVLVGFGTLNLPSRAKLKGF